MRGFVAVFFRALPCSARTGFPVGAALFPHIQDADTVGQGPRVRRTPGLRAGSIMAEDQKDAPEAAESSETEMVARDVEQAEGAVASTEPEAALTEPATDSTPETPEASTVASAEDDTEVVQEAERPVPVHEEDEDAPSLVERIKDAAEAVAERVEDVVEAVEERVEDAAEAVADRARDLVEAVSDRVEDAAEAVSERVEDATEAVTERAKEAVKAVRARFTGDDEGPSGDGAPGGYTGREAHETVKLSDLESRETSAEARRQREQLTQLLDDTFTRIPQHDIVKGRVVTVSDKDVVIDVGGKSDGIVAKSEWSGEVIEPGQEVEVYVERLENRQGQLDLSKTKADATLRWRRIQNAFETEEVLEGEIIRRIKGGMIVQLFDNIEAFLPGSQIDVRPVRDFDAYLGRHMEFKIVKLNETNQNIVVSHKALIEQDLASQRQSILESMEPGQVLEGTVKNITDFGVFVDLGGVDGLLHITDLSWGRVQHPSEVVSVDEKLNVVVLDYDKDRQRISLGLKQLQSHPWETIHEKYAEGQVVEGKVVSITDYGAFVELEKGIEGLVHISEMSWTEHVKHPSQVVTAGQTVEVKLLGIDDDNKKISLGMKQLQEDPWSGIAARFPIGTTMRGKVRNITAFGVFVEIEPGIDGLVHISDLSWTKNVRHPGEVVKKGQELDVKVIGIDERNRRISLSHKEVQTDPWQTYGEVYSEGSEHTATVLRVHDKGLDVELANEFEGYVPASELKRSGHPADHYREGQPIEGLRVIRFDRTNKEIILSETAAERQAEFKAREGERSAKREEREQARREIQDYQRQQSSSGPATLGEMSGLEALRDRMRAEEEGDGANA
jgi:small subunit ribosomal protein S1